MAGAQLLGLWTDSEPDPLDSVYSDLHNRRSMLLQVCLLAHQPSQSCALHQCGKFAIFLVSNRT